ncbi:MAG: PAS domain S-box protein [Betaproteobacteria bacterium]|nr:PAS domain S-box protein [Betaproteobacteria bacterium]
MNCNRHNISTLIARALERPLVKFGVMLGAIFLVELAAHGLQFDMPGWAGALIDAAILTALASIIMWPLIVKPLRVALMTAQARAQTVLDTVTDAIITIDDHGIIQAQNRAARITFGVSDEDAIGRNIDMIVPSPHHEHHDRYLENYRRTGVKHVIGTTRQLDAMRVDGEVFPIELSVSEGWAGGRRFFTATIRDITARKRTEERLQKLSNAVEQSPAATVITDTSGRFEYVNPKFLEVTGFTREDLVGRTPAVIKSGLTPPEVYEDLWRTIRSGREWRGDMQNRKRNGELYWEHEIISALKNDRGEIVNFIAVKEDITARRQAEDALQRQQVRLLETERELLNAHESLADAARLESVGRLAASVAHEVKNPLMIIRLGIDYLSKQFSQDTSQEVLDQIRGAIVRADNVIRDLLDFSRKKPFARRPTNINQVIDNAIHLTTHEIERRNIEIVRNCDDPMPLISADPDRLLQVFVNLFSNAAQAIGRDGSIEVVARSIRLSERDLERSEGSAFRIGEPVISVDIRDNGPGFSDEHEKKLFEPFFTTKPMGEGYGLGLAVSHNIVIMHEGSINITNRPEGGASALLMFRVDRKQLTNE